MTAASYATNLVEIIGDTQTASSTGWTALGGGASALNPGSTELFIEGSQSMTKDAFGTRRRGMIYDTGSDQGGSGTDGAYSFWCTFTSIPSLDTKAGAGFDVLIGSSAAAYEHYHVFGSDTIPFGGWFFAAVNEDTAGDETTGSPTANEEHSFGVLADATAAGAPSKGETIGLDTVREGRHDIVITLGTTPDADASFDGVITNLETATLRWGLLAQREPGGAFENSGLIQFGSTGGNEVNFTDSNKVIFLRDHDHVTANFHTWEVQNTSSVINFTNLVVKALGATSPGRWVTTDNATMTWTTCQFIDMGTFSFLSNATVDTCTFLGCGLITLGEADISGSSILTSSVAADEGAVFDDRNTSVDTDLTEFDNCTFSQGTNAHHAIRFGANVTNNVTLTGCEFTGFSGTDDVNGSTFRFDGTTGSINLNLVNCTVDGVAPTQANIGVDDAAGITVTVVIAPVTETVNVKASGVNVENARVFVETAATIASGEMFEAAVTSLTSATGTATCTTTGVHGLVTGDQVVIRGAQPDEYNKVATVTVTSTTAFEYTVPSGISSPATGTPVVSFVVLQGLTDASGNISKTRTWGAAQELKGWARKINAASPFYKQSDISYNVDISNGNTINVALQPDE